MSIIIAIFCVLCGVVSIGCIFLAIVGVIGLLLRVVECLVDSDSDKRKHNCPLCNKPVTSDHPKADVYHMSCLKEGS